jgi:hypothetical protein
MDNHTWKYLRSTKTLLPYLIILLLVSISYYGVLAGKLLLLDRDLYWFFYQNSHYLADNINAGKMPLWNPYVLNGEPFFAQAQPGVLYPLHWLYSFIPVEELFSRLLVLHVALSGIFMAMLIREMGGGRTAATIGGISIAFSGITTSLLGMQSSLFAVAWLPFSFWSLLRVLRHDSINYAILTGLGFAVMIFVGGIEVFAMGLAVAAIIITAPHLFPIECEPPDLRRRLILFGAILLSFFLISAVQLIPFAELTRYSYRTEGIDVSEGLTWSLHPQEWLYFVLPDVFRRGKEFYWNEQNWLRTIYVGVVPILLALAFSLKTRKRSIGLLCIGAGCLLLSTGNHLPVYRDIVEWIPGIRSIRYPSKFLMISGFLLALAAGLGWDRLFQRPDDPDREKTIPGVFMFLSVTFAAALFAAEILDVHFQNWWGGMVEERGWELLPDGLLHNSRRFLALSAITSLAIFFTFKGGKIKKVGLVMIPILLVMDLMGAMPYATSFHPADCLEKEPERIARLKKEDGLFRVYSHNNVWERKFEDGSDLILGGTDIFMPNAVMSHSLFNSQGYRVLTLSRVDQIMRSITMSEHPDSSRLIDLLNIRYIMWPAEVPSTEYTLIESSDSLYFYENMGALDRAFLSDSYQVCSTGIEYQNIMEDPGFDPLKVVLLDEEPSVPSGWDTQQNKGVVEDEQVEILCYEAERIIIQVSSSGSKFLVLSDAYFPGWKAEVNGEKVKIHRANYAFRAIPLNAGESIVDLRYEPESFLVGASISSGSIILFLGFLVTCYLYRLISGGLLARNCHLSKLVRVKARSSHE